MKLAELQRKLMDVARRHEPSEHVPYAFERRVMARLSHVAIDQWASWSRALWRAAASCVLATMILGAWPSASFHSDEPELSEQFEEALFVALDQQLEDSW